MRRFAVLVFFIAVIMPVFGGEITAQTEQQKEALERYLREKGEDTGKVDSIKKSPDIYEEKVPRVPPETEEGKGVKGGERGGRLKRFGLELFSHPPGKFVASTQVPVPSDYTLGPGDHISINLWGSVNERIHMVIDREGKVFIPKAGELVLWGLTLDGAKARIKGLLDEIYSDFRFNVVLGKIRSITVYVGGEVVRPGAYTVSSLYTLFNTLYLAGGPTRKGSLRHIRLVRGGRVKGKFDLYCFLIRGENCDIRLQSNDIIFVPVVGDLVEVRGEVKRPAVYEIRDDERLLNVLELAGGVKSSGYMGNVQLVRYNQNAEKILLSLDLSDEAGRKENDLKLKDNDIITVRRVHDFTRDVVYLRGEVKYGGEYEYYEGMKVSDLVNPDLLLPDSYLERAFLTRILPGNRKKMFAIDLRKVMGGDIENCSQHESGSICEGNTGSGKDNSRVYGDIDLHPRDRLEIFHVDRMTDSLRVRVAGEVRYPGQYPYARGMTVSDLLISAGGVKRNAYLLKGELARLNYHSNEYSVLREFKVRKALLNSHGELDPCLQPGDLVHIRREPGYHEHETVRIEGEVLFPGSYVIKERGETLVDLIERAGGLTSLAFPSGALFYRSSLKEELEGRGVEEVIQSLQRTYMDSLGGVKIQRKPVDGNVNRIKRIIIDLPGLVENYNRADDIVLRGGDRILIPQRPSGVSVMGAVASNGTIKFEPGKKAFYYIDRAGGLRKNSDRDEIRIIRASGRVIKEDAISEKVSLGDVIIVPEKVLKDRNWLRIFQASVSIISGAITTVFLITKL